MKRHDDNPNLLAADPAAKFSSANHGMVNGRFCVTAASSPCFWRKIAPIRAPEREFCGTVRPYGAVLLTMIKIVLIAAISFASPSQ
jgi:hypothetical protein